MTTLVTGGRAKLQRMVDIVDDGNVFPEELLTHSFDQAGTLIVNCGRGKIVKEKTDQIESGRRLENDRVFSRSEFQCVLGLSGLFTGAGG